MYDGGEAMLLEGFIICNDNTKEEILKNSNGFNDYSFLKENELIKRLYGEYKPEALFYLMEEYGLTDEVAMEYLSYMPYLNKDSYNDIKLDSILAAKRALIANKLYKVDSLFRYRLKQYPVTIIDFNNESLLNDVIKDLKQYTEVHLSNIERKSYTPRVYSLKTITDECLFIMNSIIKLYNSGVSLNNIYLLNMDADYEFIFKRLEREYGLPIAFPKERGILELPIAIDFLRALEGSMSFTEVMEGLDNNNPYYKPILKLIIDYNLRDKDPKNYIEFFKRRLSEIPVEAKAYKEMIRTNEKNSYSDKDYIFFMGCNLGATPRIYKDEGYLNDNELSLISLSTSIEKNKEAKKRLIELLTKNKNVIVSYKRIAIKDVALPANIIAELSLPTEEIEVSLGGNEIEDRIRLGVATTRYMKYKSQEPDLALKANIRYLSYDNSFKGVEKERLDLKFNESRLKLAYSNLKTYYSCPFNYYLDKVLDLNEYKSTSATRLGTYAHKVLEDSYNEGFSLDEASSSAIIANMDEDEQYKDFFYMSQMKEVLRDLIDYNREYEEKSQLKIVKRELDLGYEGDGFSFIGYIDKLLYTEINGEVYCAIIDYKTGSDYPSLDNVEDGFNLQLPVYMLLLRKYKEFDGKPIHIIGIYLQKINIVALDNTIDILEQRRKAFRLRGYSTSSIPELVLLDPDFNKSTYIQSMMLTKDGAFGRYSKVISPEDMDRLIEATNELINKAATNIHNGSFPIAPKRIDKQELYLL